MNKKIQQAMNTVDGALIESGPFDGFKLISQEALGVRSELVNVYNSQDRHLGYVHRDMVEEFMEGAGAVLRPIDGWENIFSRSLMEKLGLAEGERQSQDEPAPREEAESFMVATDDFDSHFRYKIEGMGFLELMDLWEKGVGDLHVDLGHPEEYDGEMVVVTCRPGFEPEFKQLREDLAHSIVPEQKPSGPRM